MRVYDADSATASQVPAPPGYPNPVQSGSVGMRIYDDSNNSIIYDNGNIPVSNDEYIDIGVNIQANHKYSWVWYNISPHNGLQIWMPYSEMSASVVTNGQCIVGTPPSGNVAYDCANHLLNGAASDIDSPGGSLTIRAYYGAPNHPTPLGTNIVGMAAVNDNGGYWLAGSNGGVFSFGDANFFGSAGGIKLNSPIVGMASTPSGNGYWLVAGDGGVFAYGDARPLGSMGGQRLNQPVVGMAVTSDGGGYWLVGRDGGVYSFGNAGFYGSLPGLVPNVIRSNPNNIVGIMSRPQNDGYWLIGSDGGVFGFGNAGFNGSLGGQSLNQPIRGGASTPSGNGYWLVGGDGGVFAFGDAYNPSPSPNGLPGMGISVTNIVGIARTSSGNGYWLVGSDGGIFSFGDADYNGAATGPGNVVQGSTNPANNDQFSIDVTNLVSRHPQQFWVYAVDPQTGQEVELSGSSINTRNVNCTPSFSCRSISLSTSDIVEVGGSITFTIQVNYQGTQPTPATYPLSVSIGALYNNGNVPYNAANSVLNASVGPLGANPAGDYQIQVSIGNMSGNTCNHAFKIVRKPYFRVYDGDVIAGINAQQTGCNWVSLSTSAAIYAYGLSGADAGRGAAAQLAAMAMGKIDGFSSGSGGNPSLVPKGLTFANTDASLPFGGNFGAGFGCPDNYFAGYNPNDPTVQNISGTVALDTMSGTYYANGPITLTQNGTGSFNTGEAVTIYVNGNVTINHDLQYNSSQSWSRLDKVPSLYVIVKGGNIYVNNNVSNLDGVYIVQSNSTDQNLDKNNGTFYSCANNGTVPDANFIASSCNSKLTINGALIAEKVKFFRSNGTLAQSPANSPGTPATPGTPGVGRFNATWNTAWPTSVALTPGCVRISEPADPNTWDDNVLCVSQETSYGSNNYQPITDMNWNYAGPAGSNCVSWNEPSDPDTWTDNYLCSATNHGFAFSIAGPIANMSCWSVNEAAEPPSHFWSDNYFCAPQGSAGTPGTPGTPLTPNPEASSSGNIGEVINYSPELWLVPPAPFKSTSSQTYYDSISSLPPVL